MSGLAPTPIFSLTPVSLPRTSLPRAAWTHHSGCPAEERDAAGSGRQREPGSSADVSTDSNDFIYDRAFGQDAQATAEYVSNVVKTMDAQGIGSVLKHFPGYGNNVDTHTGVAIDERPYETFQTSDYLPLPPVSRPEPTRYWSATM